MSALLPRGRLTARGCLARHAFRAALRRTGALGLVSACCGARPHPDERSGLAITALWLAVATGSVALGACVASLRGLRHGRAFPRFVVAALGTVMALTTIVVVVAALQNKRGHEHTSGDDRRRTRTVLVVTLLTEMSLAAIRAAAADVVRKIVGDQFRQRGDAFDEVTGFETSRVRPVAEQRRDPGVFARAPPKPPPPAAAGRCVALPETIGGRRRASGPARTWHPPRVPPAVGTIERCLSVERPCELGGAPTPLSRRAWRVLERPACATGGGLTMVPITF